MSASDDVNYRLQLNIFLLVVLFVTGLHGRITKSPTDSVVLKGKTNVFTCCSDIPETFFWKHKPVGSRSIYDIYDLHGLVDEYLTSGRFNVTPDISAGCYSLVIKNVTSADVGMYTCIDDAGLYQMKGWELIILESFGCQETNHKVEYMGENDFGLPQDVISAVCIAKYFGNMPPQPICEWSSGNKLPDNYHRLTETNLTVTLSIQLPATKEFNGDQLLCYVKKDVDSSDKQTETAWMSPHLIINYASIYQKGVPQCSVDNLSPDCQPMCNYKMMRTSNGSIYYEITYPGKTSQKIFILLPDNNMPSPALSPVDSNNAVIIALTSVTTGIICIVVGILIYCVSNKKCSTQGNREEGESRVRYLHSSGGRVTTRPTIGNNNSTEVARCAPENGGGGNTVTTNPEFDSSQQSSTTSSEIGDSRNGTEAGNLLHGIHLF